MPDGRQSPIIVSDNNFNPNGQFTQFLAFALDLETTPAALPTVETPQAIDDENADSPLQGNSDDSQAGGQVVDRELGVLYVGMEGEVGVVKYDAEPNGGMDYDLVLSVDDVEPDIEGLTIYYGADGAGYLLVSSQGDSRFVLLERTGDNAEVGRLVIADNLELDIDQDNECDGADVINVALGPYFPRVCLSCRMAPTILRSWSRTTKSSRTRAPISSWSPGSMSPRPSRSLSSSTPEATIPVAISPSASTA